MLRKTKPHLPREVEVGLRARPRNQPKQSPNLHLEEELVEDVEGQRRKKPRKKNPKMKTTIKKKKRKRSKTTKSILTTTNDLLKSLATQSITTKRPELNYMSRLTPLDQLWNTRHPFPCCHISTSFRLFLFKLFII